MTIVAIHQPNYAPWLGYFSKLARADVFVFLDDAQYSKNNYINRVQIDARGKQRWLTIPVRYNFGDPINRVRAADEHWRRSHLDVLRAQYIDALFFSEVMAWLDEAFAHLPDGDIATSNQSLIEAFAVRLGIQRHFVRASEFATGSMRGDDRLIAILQSIGPHARYLSGKGGDKYQDPHKFTAIGISLFYNDFVHPRYDQGHPDFLPGLSVLDALFRLGFERTATLVRPVDVLA